MICLIKKLTLNAEKKASEATTVAAVAKETVRKIRVVSSERTLTTGRSVRADQALECTRTTILFWTIFSLFVVLIVMRMALRAYLVTGPSIFSGSIDERC